LPAEVGARTTELILSFAEDEKGEVYLLAPSLKGQGIYRFEAAKGE
jgi:hypothetical protein